MTKTEPLQITPGEVYTTVQDPAFQNWEIRLREDDMRITATMSIDCSAEEECANATLYADAHNTYNALPVLPSELKRRLEEAEANRAALLKERDQSAVYLNTLLAMFENDGCVYTAQALESDLKDEIIAFLSTQTPTDR
jgi:hypothetical protein